MPTGDVSCPVCHNIGFQEFVNFGVIPRSGTFLPNAQAPFPKGRLEFESCPRCCLIRLRVQCAENQPDYRSVDRPTSRQLPTYLDEIIDSLSHRHPGRQGLIVDVGGNDGGFLNLVTEAGYTNRLSVEPSVALAETCRKAGHRVENVQLDSSKAARITQRYGQAGVIFCRHVLEHVADPFGLLLAMKSMLAEEGSVFIEMPDATGVLHSLLVHELWDEHLYHFTFGNLKRLLSRAGFAVEWHAIRPHRGGANILIWVRSGSTKKNSSLNQELGSGVSACKNFKDRWVNLRERIQSETKKYPKPIGCLGASHSQSNYVLFSGIGEQIDFLVDDDPSKISRYVPVPRPIPVISTTQLLNAPPPGTIIRTAFGCEDWMDRVCQPLAAKGVHIVEPYVGTTTQADRISGNRASWT